MSLSLFIYILYGGKRAKYLTFAAHGIKIQLQAAFTNRFESRKICKTSHIYREIKVMKKLVLLFLLAAVAMSCCLGLTACNPLKQPTIPTDADFTSTSLAPDGRSVADCTPQENLYMATHVMKSLGFKSVNNGSSKAVGITQKVYSERTYLNGAVASKTTSLGFVKLGKQFYYENGSYVVRDASKVKDINDVQWESGANRLSKERFESLYGLPPVWLTAFVTNNDSIKEARLVEEKDGIYTFEYKLDNVVSIYYLKYQMRTYSGSKGFPVFDENNGIVMTVRMNKDRIVSSISTVCNYKVDILGDVKCEERLEEVFSEVGQISSIPERTFFEPYLNANITENPDTETVSGVLLDTFMPLLKNNSLCANVKLSGLVNTTAKVKAVIDTQNLENITVDLFAHDIDLLVSYRAGRLTLNLGDLNAHLDLNDISTPADDDTGESAEEGESLLDGASLITNGDDYTVLLPLGPLSVEINAVKTDDGNFEFEDAVLGPIVVSIEETSQFVVPEADTENSVSLLPLVKQFASAGGSLNFAANIADFVSANISIPLNAEDSGIFASIEAGDEDIFAKVNGKQVALRYKDLKMKMAYKDLLNALFNRFYDLDYVRDLVNMLSGMTNSLSLSLNGTVFENDFCTVSLGLGTLNLNAKFKIDDAGLSLDSLVVPLNEKEVVLSLAEQQDFSPIADSASYPDGTGLLDIINQNLEIDLAATLGDYQSRLLFDLKTLQAKFVALPIAESSLKLSVLPDSQGKTTLYLSSNGFDVMFGQDDILGQIQLLERLLNHHSTGISELISSLMAGVGDMTVSANTQTTENGVSLILTVSGLEVKLNFSNIDGRLFFADAQAVLNETTVNLKLFDGDETQFSFIEDTSSFLDGSPLLPLDETLKLNAAIDFAGIKAFVMADLVNLEIKAVIPDLYNNNVYASVQAKTGTFKFKFGGLNLKTDIAGVAKLAAFVAPLIGEQKIEALLNSLASININPSDLITNLKIIPFDTIAEDNSGVSFETTIGSTVLSASVIVSEGKYYPSTAKLTMGNTQILISPCEEPNFSEFDAETVFPEVTALLDMFTDYKLAFEADINGIKTKIGLDILNGEVYAQYADLSAMYFSDVRETDAGQEKYGKVLLKYGTLKAQADVERLLLLVPKISEKLGIQLPQAQISFNPEDIINGFVTTETSVTLNFSLYMNNEPIALSVLFLITDNGLCLSTASASYKNIVISLSPCDFGSFYPFDKQDSYLDLNLLAEDYIDIVLDLATSKAWHFDANGSFTTQKTIVDETTAETQIEEVKKDFSVVASFALSQDNLLDALALKLNLTDALTNEQTTLEAVFQRDLEAPATQGTIFVNYNGLKAKITINSVKQIPLFVKRAAAIVPALNDLLDGLNQKLNALKGSANEIDFTQLLQNISYSNGALALEIAENALVSGLGKVSVAISQENDTLKLAANNLTLIGIGGYDKISANAQVGVNSKTYAEVNDEIALSVGDVNEYTSFDSIPDLLNVLVNTLETRHISASGVASLQIAILQKEVPISIKADIHADGRITAVVKLEVSGKLVGLFENVSLLGGSHVAYLYIDTASDSFLMKRIDTINKAFFQKEIKTSYKKILFSELEQKGMEILFFMTDLSSAICGEINNAVNNAPDNPFKIEEAFVSYAYNQGNFKLDMNLTSYNPTLGAITLSLSHNENMLLSQIYGKMALNMSEQLSGTIELKNMFVSTHDADLNTKAEIEAETNSGNY